MNSNATGTGGIPVLYVEDNAVNVLLLTGLFTHRPGLELLVATHGAEALRRAAAIRPALLLLDLGLPDCHGSELLIRLRKLPGCRDVPAVAVTAENDFCIQGTSFCELWSKPLDLYQVLARLDALVPSQERRSVERADNPPRHSSAMWESRRAA